MVRSVLIIGAGLAGLSTGCYAQMNGYDSQILEHDSKPGGVAAWWKRGDYLIDGGIHFLMGHRPGSAISEIYRELGVVNAENCVDLSTYLRFIDEETGRKLDVTTDLGQFEEDLIRLSPGDSGKIQKLVREACRLKGRASALFDAGMGSPPELKRSIDMLKELWSMRSFYKYFFGDFSKPLTNFARSVHNPLITRIMENLFFPEGPVWFAVMMLALMGGRQLGLLQGGCSGFVLPLEKRYKDLGGKVTYDSTVQKILVENNKAIGVRLVDGRVYTSDVVVSAADGYNTIFGMLDARYMNHKIEKQYKTWRLCRPTVIVSFGAAREFQGHPPLNMFLLKDPIKVGSHDNYGLSLRILNYGRDFAPKGKTVIQAILETNWDYWESLRKDKTRYDSQKDRVAREVLSRLEAHYPGLASQVEMTDVATPYTTWRYTLNRRGSYMGWLMTKNAIMTQMPRSLPGLRGLYMAGQWVVPGGGVPSCIFSGRQVVQILCQQDRRPFRTSVPPGSVRMSRKY